MLRRLALLLGLLAALPAVAVESPPHRSPRATVTLVAEVAAVAPGEAFRLGLRIRLAEGWHSYWRNAGDAGAAPEITLALPPGASAGPFQWPAPERIEYGPLVNFGYQGEVLLPLTVSVPARLSPGDAFRVAAEASWLVCADVCIPEEGQFTLTLPVAAQAVPSPIGAPLFEATERALPRPWAFGARAGAGGERASLTLSAPILGPGTVTEAFFFPAEPGLLSNTAPQPMTLQPGLLRLALSLAPGAAPSELAGTLVLRDGGGQRAAFDIAAPVAGPPEGSDLPGFALALGMALLGGLILNLMPCVFPVLAMKAMALARLSGAARSRIRAEAASYTAGVLLSFAAIGGALVALRAGGSLAGWGFQFTDPAFVAAMAWLVLGVGLNLSGVFAMGAPIGAGQAVTARGGHLGAFATGALAVLLATPCTAPFMAAALGAALLMPAWQTVAVFLALGLGLAAPYALLGLWPGLAQALPRPGAWMEALRQALAFPMYATAAWLIWVLAQQAGADGVFFGLAGAVALAALLWALGRAQRAGAGRARIAGAVALGGALVLAGLLLPRLSAAPAVAAAPDPGAEPWSAARVAALRAEGRPVFINATAAWCITCQVNERVALRGAGVQAAFAARGVAYLKADWTRGDPAIGALLREQGREGVPMYLYWAPGAAQPVLLPQILTEGIVIAALGGA
jgi:thiol:disulfide interchange protein DsbD